MDSDSQNPNLNASAISAENNHSRIAVGFPLDKAMRPNPIGRFQGRDGGEEDSANSTALNLEDEEVIAGQLAESSFHHSSSADGRAKKRKVDDAER